MSVTLPSTTEQPGKSPATVPLLDVNRGNQQLHPAIMAAIERVVQSGRFLHGPDVTRLEKSMAEYCGAEQAVGCASGSDALLLALMALDVGAGDEVIVPSFTFFATASAPWRLGARPVFVDIDPISFNLDPESVRLAITPATKAVIPVHLYGQCAAMDDILHIAQEHGLHVIEDAAQAIGASLEGKPAGSWGDVGCFSFYPTKNLGGFGDGGMLTARDAELAARLRLFAAHGMEPRYHHHVVGINSRLDSLQAAVLNVKLQNLRETTAARRQNASMYDRLFREAGLERSVGLPAELPGCEHVWNQYTIRVPGGRRDELRAALSDAGIGSEIYYPTPLHLQKCFRSLGHAPGSLPRTERAASEVLSLPIFAEVTIHEQEAVVRRIVEFYAKRRAA